MINKLKTINKMYYNNILSSINIYFSIYLIFKSVNILQKNFISIKNKKWIPY